MNKLFFTTFLLSGLASAQVSQSAKEDHKTEHEHVFTPAQEEAYKLRILRSRDGRAAFRFAQTQWKECVDNPSGNYSGAACASSRQISVILKELMSEGMYECVDAGLRAQGGGTAEDLHIIHDGILGDRAHSPRSLHSEARAIDIRSFRIGLSNGTTRTVNYAGTANRAFYRAFRRCWGNFIKRENGCPLYRSSAELTASIGWEDADHQRHLHTSVPYCVNGRYNSAFFQK